MKKILLSLLLLGGLVGCSDTDSCSEEDTSYYGDCRPVNTMTDDEKRQELEDMVEDNLD